MDDSSEIQSDIIDRYVNEILHVFTQLKNITISVQQRLGAKKPAWIPLQPNGDETVRDHILCKYAEYDTVVCPLSQDLSSNRNTFDVDHFYPDASLMDALDNLIQAENQPLLQAIKSSLIKKIGQKDANILIPNKSGQLDVTGLKQIYYNYIGNLWPISGPTNSAKGKKASFSFSIFTVLNKLELLLPTPILLNTKQQFFSEFGLNFSDYAALDLSEQAKVLSENLVEKFDRQCLHQNYILPYYIGEEGEFVSMLDFFKNSSIGKIAFSFAQETARWSLSAISIGRSIAANYMSEDSKKRSYAKSIGKALTSMHYSRGKLLDSQDPDSQSTGSASTDTLEGLETVSADLNHVYKKVKDRHDTKRLTQERADSDEGSSSLIKKKLAKLKESSGISQEHHPVESVGKVHKVKGDGNCFFRAVAKELARQELSAATHQELRLQAVLYLLEHREEIFPTFPLEEDEDVNDYLERMAQNGVYVEQHIIEALAMVLDVQLTIIRVQENGEQNQMSINASVDRKVIGLIHRGDGELAHYDALEFVDDEDEETASLSFSSK